MRPRLEDVRSHREANVYSLLIVTLLERGEAMTLEEVAARFAGAGVTTEAQALASLKRCQPARPPIYRDGARYHLDPHDDELGLWVFRLGLRPPMIPRLAIVRPPPDPLPGADVRLAIAELDEAWRDASLYSWSATRLALAVIDAHGEPMIADDVVAFVAARTRYHMLNADPTKWKRPKSAVRLGADDRWSIAEDAPAAVASARVAVRSRIESLRRASTPRFDPAVAAANAKAAQRRREARATELAKLRRVLLAAFPAHAPAAVAVLDVEQRAIDVLVGAEVEQLTSRLEPYDVIGAVDARALLRALRVEPGSRRLHDLGPPQKTKKLNARGRTLKITTEMLVRGSCGISTPFGDPAKLATYLANGKLDALRRRLEADVKSLHALYAYGRLHHAVRLRWGFLDERFPAPWVHRDEPWLFTWKQQALEGSRILEVVTGSAPGWSDPWSRAQRASVVRPYLEEYTLWLVDEHGFRIADDDVQAARLVDR